MAWWNRDDSVVTEVARRFEEMQATVETLDERQRQMAESAVPGLGMAALAAEDRGWKLLNGDSESDELDLSDIKAHAKTARALRAMNPLVKRGIIVRNAYVWAQPINYPESAKPVTDDPVNQKALFSDEAQEELEAAFATDGQYFLLLDQRKRQARRLPMSEITGVATNPEFSEEIWFYKRTYTVKVTDGNGQEKADQREVYYPAIDYRGETKQKTIGKVPVDYTKRIEHAAVNRQVGWRYGVPDLLGAVYWARAYKEYLEASYTLSKALARLAFKVSNQSGKGQKASATKLAQPVSRQEAGSTAVLGMGQDLVAINKSGAGVDFAAGTPLAAMVAASLDIALSVLLTDGSAGGRQGAEAALEDPTIKSMDLRRKAHLASRRRVLAFFGITDEITWPKINADQVHRRLQAIVLAKGLGVLHPEEVRAATVQALDIISERTDDEVPDTYTAGASTAEPGALSDGTNDSRDNPGGPTDA